MISLISSLSLKFVGVSSKHLRVFLESLRKSSGIFGNSWKMFGSVRPAFGTILKFLRKSWEGGRKSSGNHQKRRHQHVYIIKRALHGCLKIMNFIFSWQKTIFYSLAALVRKILFCHSKIKFISSRPRVISSIYIAVNQVQVNTRLIGHVTETLLTSKIPHNEESKLPLNTTVQETDPWFRFGT